MAKTLLEFEGEMLNTYDIKSIAQKQKWSDKKMALTFNIEINSDYIDSSLIVPYYKFEYKTEEQRNNAWELLKIQLDGLDYFEII